MKGLFSSLVALSYFSCFLFYILLYDKRFTYRLSIFWKASPMPFLRLIPPLYQCPFSETFISEFPFLLSRRRELIVIVFIMDAVHPIAFLRKHRVSSSGNAQYSIVLSSHWFVPPFSESLLYNFKMEFHHDFIYLKRLWWETDSIGNLLFSENKKKVFCKPIA